MFNYKTAPRVGQIFRAPVNDVRHLQRKKQGFPRFLIGKTTIFIPLPPNSMLESLRWIKTLATLIFALHWMVTYFNKHVKISMIREKLLSFSNIEPGGRGPKCRFLIGKLTIFTWTRCFLQKSKWCRNFPYTVGFFGYDVYKNQVVRNFPDWFYDNTYFIIFNIKIDVFQKFGNFCIKAVESCWTVLAHRES